MWDVLVIITIAPILYFLLFRDNGSEQKIYLDSPQEELYDTDKESISTIIDTPKTEGVLDKVETFESIKILQKIQRFELTKEFEKAFNEMENTTNCIYVTGRAGTGKSTLLNYFRQNTKKNVIVLAPTGIAAINVDGSTIHSFFHFPLKLLKKEDVSRDFSRQELFNKIDTIIIDEISMVRADILDCIDQSLKLNRKNNVPFGGVQMVFFGDLYQLPPVVVGKELTEYFDENFGGPYFFNAHIFKEIRLNYFELLKIFRQKDNSFKKILNGIREDKITEIELQKLNERYNADFSFKNRKLCLILSSTNKIANDINNEKINELPNQAFFYRASVSGKFDKNSYPTEVKLLLKSGAQIMMLKNDTQKRWVNGTLGIVDKLTEYGIWVNIGGTVYELEKATWEVVEYRYNKENKKIETIVTGAFTQYPLKLAWAITIHKSQGQTFDNVVIDLGRGAFAHGQVYVALSRCRTLNGITLRTKIYRKDIILDTKVVKFMQQSRLITKNQGSLF